MYLCRAVSGLYKPEIRKCIDGRTCAEFSTPERRLMQMGEPDQGSKSVLHNPEIRKVQMCELVQNTPSRLSNQREEVYRMATPGDHVPSALPTSEKDACKRAFLVKIYLFCLQKRIYLAVFRLALIRK